MFNIMLDIGGFLTSVEFLTQLATFITALLTGILQMFIVGSAGM